MTYFMNRRSLNIDINFFRCPLECPRCQRQRHNQNNVLKVPGCDLTLKEIDKISDFYNDFHFVISYLILFITLNFTDIRNVT